MGRNSRLQAQVDRGLGFQTGSVVTNDGDGGWDVQAADRPSPWTSVGRTIDYNFLPSDRALLMTSGERDTPALIGISPWVTEGQIVTVQVAFEQVVLTAYVSRL